MAARPAARAAPSPRSVPHLANEPHLAQAPNEVAGNLKKAGSVKLDSSGRGVVSFITDNSWQRWEVDAIAVKTNQGATQVPVPVAEAFVNDPSSAGNSEGGTSSGSQDTMSGRINLSGPDTLNIVWTGGISGTIATAIVTGTKYTKRSR